jgi:hypothetical protein
LSNSIKQKRKEKAGKWSVPLPKVRGIPEDEMFRTVTTGKRHSKFLFSSSITSEYSMKFHSNFFIREGMEENGH